MPAILIVIGAVVVIGALALAFLPSKPAEETTTPNPTPVVEIIETTNATPPSLKVKTAETSTAVAKTPMEQVMDSPMHQMMSTYTDGTYSTSLSYKIPSGGLEPVKVTLTLDNDVITNAELEFEGIVGTSRLNQGKFLKAYEAVVIGKDIDELSLARVGGASLTTKAFNQALLAIKADAKS